MGACPAKRGDYFEFLAEIDLLCALSTCPGGDLSVRMWGNEESSQASSGVSDEDVDPTLKVCRPIQVEVFALPEGALEGLGWKSPECNGPQKYQGMHAMRPREWNAR
jgi:uncharacterized protein